jgi:hypothetical protein
MRDTSASTGLILSLELRLATRRRRLFVLNTTIPLLLVAPVALSGAPTHHKAAVYTVLFALFGTFGSAIPLLRDAEHGLLQRIGRTTIPPSAHLLERAGAGAMVDSVQLVPACLAVLWGGSSANLATSAWLLPVVGGSLLVANLVGIWVASIARSIAEGALFAAVTALFLVHASGTFRSPTGLPGQWIETVSPYRGLHELLLEIASGGTGVLGGGGWALFAWVLLASLATGGLAPAFLDRLTRAGTA